MPLAGVAAREFGVHEWGDLFVAKWASVGTEPAMRGVGLESGRYFAS